MDNIIDEPYIAGGEPGPATLSSSTTQDLTKIVSFMREDQDHIVFKRFERLNLYNLLYLQHRLTAVDKKITLHEDKPDVHALAKVLSTLEPLMKSYNEALLLHDRLRNLPRTTPRLASFLKDHSEHNLVELKHELDPEAGWSEVVSLSSTPKGWIHKFIDSHYQLRRLFRKPGTSDRQSNILLYSENAVRRTEQTLVNLSFCILVLGPIFVLSFLTSKVGKLFLVLAFVVPTAILASVLSDNAQKSSLAVMAGYTAILVVFLSNNVGSG